MSMMRIEYDGITAMELDEEVNETIGMTSEAEHCDSEVEEEEEESNAALKNSDLQKIIKKKQKKKKIAYENKMQDFYLVMDNAPIYGPRGKLSIIVLSVEVTNVYTCHLIPRF